MNAIREYRRHCRLHMLRRAKQRGLALSTFQLYRLERKLDRAKADFVVADLGARYKGRYKLTVVIAGERFSLVYDTQLRCLVTILRHDRPRRGPAPKVIGERHART